MLIQIPASTPLATEQSDHASLTDEKRKSFESVVEENIRSLLHTYGYPYSLVIKGRLADYVAVNVPAVKSRWVLSAAHKKEKTSPSSNH
jgi:hypothetical protein